MDIYDDDDSLFFPSSGTTEGEKGSVDSSKKFPAAPACFDDADDFLFFPPDKNECTINSPIADVKEAVAAVKLLEARELQDAAGSSEVFISAAHQTSNSSPVDDSVDTNIADETTSFDSSFLCRSCINTSDFDDDDSLLFASKDDMLELEAIANSLNLSTSCASDFGRASNCVQQPDENGDIFIVRGDNSDLGAEAIVTEDHAEEPQLDSVSSTEAEELRDENNFSRRSSDALMKQLAFSKDITDLLSSPCGCSRQCYANVKALAVAKLRLDFWGERDAPAPKTSDRRLKLDDFLRRFRKPDADASIRDDGAFSFSIDNEIVCENAYLTLLGIGRSNTQYRNAKKRILNNAATVGIFGGSSTLTGTTSGFRVSPKRTATQAWIIHYTYCSFT